MRWDAIRDELSYYHDGVQYFLLEDKIYSKEEMIQGIIVEEDGDCVQVQLGNEDLHPLGIFYYHAQCYDPKSTLIQYPWKKCIVTRFVYKTIPWFEVRTHCEGCQKPIKEKKYV